MIICKARGVTRNILSIVLALSFAITTLVACSSSSNTNPSPTTTTNQSSGIGKIQHIIVIMQENRSFDSYFGTYPGADGIPMENGVPTVCVPDPQMGRCVPPFHDSNDKNGGGPHGAPSAAADVDGGKMDGFIGQVEKGKHSCTDPNDPACANSATPDVMGYHDDREIPNYWSYAREYVLQDHLFESVASWSQPAHLFLVSGWSAKCTDGNDPMSCQDAIQNPGKPPANGSVTPIPSGPDYAWTDLTYLL